MDWGAVATGVGIFFTVFLTVSGFVLRMIYSNLKSQIDENKDDRLAAQKLIWGKYDKLQDEVHRDCMRRDEMRDMEQRIADHIDQSIRLAMSELRQELGNG